MEWEVVGQIAPTWVLKVDGVSFAVAWQSDSGLGYWVFNGRPGGASAESLDDAKDAAWAAVYRSTR
jgi:hypothetical protein